MPLNKSLSTIILLLIISSQLTSSQDCGHVKFKCHTPGDPACCEGKCCPFFDVYTKAAPGSSLIISNSPNREPIIETISAISARPTDGVYPAKPIKPIIDPSPIQAIPIGIDICWNVAPCPCTELQCFKERVAPYCDCECPLDILGKEARNDANICGIHSPAQIFNIISCSCSCPVGSEPERGCGINQLFNQNTCKCETMNSPSNPIVPISSIIDTKVKISGINLPGVPIKLQDTISMNGLSSKVIDAPCQDMVHCLMSPCTVKSCPSYPDAICMDNYCGGCNAIFTHLNGNILSEEQCNSPPKDVKKVSDPTEPPKATDVALTDGDLSKPIKQIQGAMEPVLMSAICPKIGEECISTIDRENRCCDGAKGGSTKCLYDDMDKNGNKIGKCCVRNKHKGCKKDKDCCEIDGICRNEICKKEKQESAKNINDQFDNFEMIKDENNSKYIALSIPTIAFIFVIMLIIFPILYYLYYKKIIIKKMKQKVRREVFHGMEINDHSDDEFADSDQDEQQYVD